MLLNYLKLALKVLGRNKFFTAISLFGISFTLLILMLITAFYDAEFGKNAPMTEKDRMVFLGSLKLELANPDTVWTIDSTLMDGTMAYDSTFTIGEDVSSTSISQFSYDFLNKHLADLETSANQTFFSGGHDYDVFLDNRKISIDALYADEEYWNLFDFEFVEGDPFTGGHVRDASPVAVITTDLAERYFGSSEEAMGQEIELGSRVHKVIGLVEKARTTAPLVAAEAFLPLTTMEARMLEDTDFHGNMAGVFLASEKADIPLIKEEVSSKVSAIVYPTPEDYNRVSTIPMDSAEMFAGMIVDQNDPAKALSIIRLVFGILLLFFVLLPTLNLINMNLSRIMEREAEIGVRKAFGAHSGTILYQFVFENIIITFIGGVIGMLLAMLVLYLINDSQVLPQLTLRFNGTVFLYSLIICLLFGIISGLLPAWKVSRLQIADVLKSNQL
ncbi:MAG: FtsX-like permease family protein [Bacteroidota bacterium]